MVETDGEDVRRIPERRDRPYLGRPAYGDDDAPVPVRTANGAGGVAMARPDQLSALATPTGQETPVPPMPQ
ncbi:hypothetical protein GCM10010405_40980 [Streptomyces macrosporus]|uniref:Uncharacterized protein n=1 Tax=Streptomyces macrosporus TaxID=44032 RepID=A0ABN3KCG5_9ACTN